MKFLVAIIEALAGFVQRNPLTVLVVLILALGAPALLKGIALFVLYFVLGLVALACVMLLLFRWRIYKVRRQMEEQFGQGFDQGGFNPFTGQPRGEQGGTQNDREGDVKVYKTQETPEKRVSGNVGDYVEFEEEKDEK